VEEDSNGSTVTAVPDKGYHFIKWSDGVKTASRTDKNIKNNITVTAYFSKNYTQTNITTAAYTVQHYKQVSDGEYALSDTEQLTGSIGEIVTARAKTYKGYKLNTAHEQTINNGTVISDNRLVLKLYYDKIPKLEVEVNDNNISFNIDGIDENVNITELNDENSSKVIITLQVNELGGDKLSDDVIKKAEELMQEQGLTLYNYFDISLIKSVIDENGNKVESIVDNNDITDDLTIRIPVPEDLQNSDNLAVVLINDDGEMQVLKTELVIIDGVKYLQFKTNHFSIYAIVQTIQKSYAWIWFVVAGIVIIAAAVYIFKKKTKNA